MKSCRTLRAGDQASQHCLGWASRSAGRIQGLNLSIKLEDAGSNSCLVFKAAGKDQRDFWEAMASYTRH